MSDVQMERISARDGIELGVHLLGEGRPLILLHGLFSSAEVNWIRFGHAAKLAAAGFRVIMPDLRAHGASAAPHDADAYPSDVLVRDLEDVIGHYGLTDFDLAGFSLGARTALRAVVLGVQPRRMALVGAGLQGLLDFTRRVAFFRDAIARFDTVRMGDPAFFTVSFMKTMKIDREAAAMLLGTLDDMDVADLALADVPTLVLCGDKDHDNGSADDLAAALPDAHSVTIPGTHMSSVSEDALGDELVRFFTA